MKKNMTVYNCSYVIFLMDSFSPYRFIFHPPKSKDSIGPSKMQPDASRDQGELGFPDPSQKAEPVQRSRSEGIGGW
jgi:hypothetical protein